MRTPRSSPKQSETQSEGKRAMCASNEIHRLVVAFNFLKDISEEKVMSGYPNIYSDTEGISHSLEKHYTTFLQGSDLCPTLLQTHKSSLDSGKHSFAWLSSLCNGKKVFITSNSSALVCLTTCIPFKEQDKRHKGTFSKQAPLSSPKSNTNPSVSYALTFKAVSDKYDPFFLDDPQLASGKHRTVMSLPSFMGSVLPYVKDKELKEEVNRQFRDQHPWIGRMLSLTLIRKMKEIALQLCEKPNHLDLSTAAYACVYLEKLILHEKVNKRNIALFMAVCLVLAAKFNQFTHPSTYKKLSESIETASIEFNVRRQDLLNMEFHVFAMLGFDLHVSKAEVLPHYKRLVKRFEIIRES